MSYETLVEQIRALPETAIDDVAEYVQFLIYKSEQNKISSLSESNEDFNQKMEKGYDDMKNGRVKTLEDAFENVKKRLA